MKDSSFYSQDMRLYWANGQFVSSIEAFGMKWSHLYFFSSGTINFFLLFPQVHSCLRREFVQNLLIGCVAAPCNSHCDSFSLSFGKGSWKKCANGLLNENGRKSTDGLLKENKKMSMGKLKRSKVQNGKKKEIQRNSTVIVFFSSRNVGVHFMFLVVLLRSS